jgi:hypothetical protein
VSSGALLVNNLSGSGTGSGSVSVNSGAILGGSGTIQGMVNNNGAVAPGSGVGILHLLNSYSQAAGGTLDIELASPATYDMLAVTGGANLAGTLDVSLADGFLPQEGDAFEILTAAALGGSMFTSTVLPDLTGDLEWNLSYGATAVTLSVELRGDFDGNGTVDSADYVAWRMGLGTKYTQADYNVWRAHFGAQASPASGAAAGQAVPEPAAWLAWLIVVLFATGSWRHRRSVARHLSAKRPARSKFAAIAAAG